MKRIVVFSLVLAIVGISQASVVADLNLRTAVINQLNLDGNYAPINPLDANRPDANDMNRPSFIRLDANSLGISDLTGLEYAKNLRILFLCNNNLTDLSPLAGLKKMQYLRLWTNPNLADLSPLADMNGLLLFWANDCNISDVNVVSKFTLLQSLKLNLNHISDVNALSGLTNLTYLNLNDNSITDINALTNLTKLVYLYLSRNDNIANISALSDMNSLAELGLIDVNLSDISPLADVNQIKYLWLTSNNIEDLSPLLGYFALRTLRVSVNPLSFVSRCEYLHQIVANNSSNPGFSVTPSISGDITADSTDYNDLRIFAAQWLSTGCNANNGYCNCADSTSSGAVNFDDFVDFADMWMTLP